MSPYPSQSRLIRRKVGFSAAKQSYPRRFKPHPSQNKVIQAKRSLSVAIQSYPGQFNLIRRKVNLSATK
jgi:hypothetical protein